MAHTKTSSGLGSEKKYSSYSLSSWNCKIWKWVDRWMMRESLNVCRREKAAGHERRGWLELRLIGVFGVLEANEATARDSTTKESRRKPEISHRTIWERSQREDRTRESQARRSYHPAPACNESGMLRYSEATLLIYTNCVGFHLVRWIGKWTNIIMIETRDALGS